MARLLNALSIRARLQLLVATALSLLLILTFASFYNQRLQTQLLRESVQQAELALRAVDASDAAALRFKIQVQEWKNLLIRGGDPKEFERYLKAFQNEHKAVGLQLDKTAEFFVSFGVERAAVDSAKTVHEALLQRYLEALKGYDPNNPFSFQAVDKAVRGIDRKPTEEIDKLSALMAAAVEKRFEAARANAENAERKALVWGLGLIALSFGVCLTLALSILRGINRQLALAVATADLVAQGDLTRREQTITKDEIGQLLGKLEQMTGGLAQIVGDIRHGSHEIAAASHQIAGATLDLSSRTEEQASAIEETSSTMEQMNATVRQAKEHAQHVNRIMQTNSLVAGQGGVAMESVVESMASISASSKQIRDITGVIDGIAFQTNILALNAAVEAARAGEQGRGFAVVAAEVRSLSQRSATAAKEIKALIDDAVARVELGEEHVRTASGAMTEILGGVDEASRLLADIALSAKEQATGIEQVTSTITQMERVTQENAAMVEEASAAAQSLNEQAGRFIESVARFRVDGEVVSARSNSARDPMNQSGTRRQIALRGSGGTALTPT